VAAAAAYALATAPSAAAAAADPYTLKNVEIVGGGFVPGITFNKTRQNLVYARTDIGGAYRWNPTTGRWIPLTDFISNADYNLLGVESLATDPVDPNRVYAAVGAYVQSIAGNGAILRSSDRGNTWARTNLPFKLGGNEPGRSIGERLQVDPNRNATLYFGTRTTGCGAAPTPASPEPGSPASRPWDSPIWASAWSPSTRPAARRAARPRPST
jgi:hypothetical protein